MNENSKVSNNVKIEQNKNMTLINKCRLCGAEIDNSFDSKTILKRYSVKYYHCSNCDLIFTENPYWLNEAYEDIMAVTDTGVMQRNIENCNKISVILKALYSSKMNCLDWGGGYGIFTRMMRDRGYNYYWADLFSKPLLVNGFEYSDEKIDLITAFECLEHFNDVGEDLNRIFSISKNVIFSTELYDAENIVGNKWEYFALETGQHIAFYSTKTMDYISKKYNCNYYNILGLHIFLTKKINLFSAFQIKFKYKLLKKIYRINYDYCLKDYYAMKDKI